MADVFQGRVLKETHETIERELLNQAHASTKGNISRLPMVALPMVVAFPGRRLPPVEVTEPGVMFGAESPFLWQRIWPPPVSG